MITKGDAARILACIDVADKATNELGDQIEALMTDDDVTNPSYSQLKGAQLKAKAASRELGKAREFAEAARKVAGR